MAIASEFTLHQVVVELQYDRGIVYLDKCGSLMLKLRDQLGAPFEPSVMPTMEFGELRSSAERIVVRYGSASTNLTQAWPRPPTPVRLEQLAPVVWETVSEALAVGRTVTRYGARFGLLWKVDTLEQAKERIRAAQLLSVSDPWRAIYGDALPEGWTAVVNEPHGTVRITLDAVETNVQAGALPADLVDVVPKFSVLLDLDHFRGGAAGTSVAGQFHIQRAQLKEFIRTSWQRTKVAATTIEKLLRSDGGGRNAGD